MRRVFLFRTSSVSAGGSLGPSLTSASAFSTAAGANADFALTFSESCDVSIAGAEVAQFQLIGDATAVTGATLRLLSQAWTGVDDARDVIVSLTSIATGLITTVGITCAVTATAPSLLSGLTFNAVEAATYDFPMTFSEDVNVSLSGAEASLFLLTGGDTAVNATSLRMNSQAYTGVDDTRDVTVTITSVATGLSTVLGITGTVTQAAAPTPLTAPSIYALSGGDWEGSTLAATPGTYTGATSITGKWQRGGPGSFADIPGANGLTYRRTEADINQGTIRYVETATSVPGQTTVQNSTSLPVTISGVIAQFMMYGGAVDLSAAPRWAELISTDTTSGPHMPDAGPGKGDGTVGYEGMAPGFASFSSNQSGNAAFPLYLKGQASSTGGSGSTRYGGLPTTGQLRVKLAGSTGVVGSNEFSIRDGVSGTELYYRGRADLLTNEVHGSDGSKYAASAWLSDDPGILLGPFTSGICEIRRKAVSPVYSHTLRAVQISYPEYALNLSTASLPGLTAYSDIASGSDTTGDGKTATPFQHLVAEPGAGGVVPSFVISPGGFNKIRSGTYTPVNFAAHAGQLVRFNGGGTTGVPATIAADTGASVILDGTESLASWGAPTAGDTNGPWENPFKASISKYTGTALTGAMTPLVDGEDHMFITQFPEPSNPADVDMAYIGSDAFMILDVPTFAAQIPNPAGTPCGADGGAGTGYHKIAITNDTGTFNVKDRYGPSNINISGATAVLMIVGNRLNSCLIINHVPSTGYFEAVMSDGVAIQVSSTYTYCKMAIRGHVFDLRQTGQYAYVGGVPYGAFETGTRGRISPLMNDGFKPSLNHLTLDGSAGAGGAMTIRRVGIGSAGFKDTGSGTTGWQGITVKGVRLQQIRDTYGRIISLKGGSVAPYAIGSLQDIYITECQGAPGIETVPGISGNGIYARDLNGTVLFTGSPCPSGTPTTWKNLNFCDMSGIHANGIAAYIDSGYFNFEQGILVNIGIPLSTQGGNGVTVRNLKFKNMIAMGRIPFPGQTEGGTLYAYQYGEAELGATLEGICMPKDVMFYGHSSTSTANTPSPGTIWKNCVFGDVIAHNRADAFAGITAQDCVFLDRAYVTGIGGGTGGIRSIADFVARGGTDGGGNVHVPGFTWTGGLTHHMQKALTENHGLGTYTARNIGNESTAFGGTGKTLIVPAYGLAFALGNTFSTTTDIRKKTRVGLHAGVLLSPEPDVTYSLPAGQGDNALFTLDQGCYWRFTGSPAGAATRHLVVDKTTSNVNVTGGSTIRTDIPINLY